MNIQHEQSETKGVFFIEEQGERIAEMSYSKAGDKRIIIDHTEVSEDQKGRGLGKKLVFHAVEYARKNKLSVLPLCPFARSVFVRFPEIRDVT